MSRNEPSGKAATAAAEPAAPSWKGHEFDSAPTAEQLSKINAEEQRAKELKAQSGQERVSITDVVKTIKAEDFTSVHKAPCSRQGLLTGIGGGAAVGALRFILRGSFWQSSNWAVGGFMLLATGSYEFCQYQRRQERESMKRVVETFEANAALKKQQEEAKQRKDAAEKQAARLAELQRQKRWYKFW